jgi:hypothetical protein
MEEGAMPGLYYPPTRLNQARIGSEYFVPLQSTKSSITTLQDGTTHPSIIPNPSEEPAIQIQHQPEAQEPGKDNHTRTGGSKSKPRRILDNSSQIPEPAR